MRRYQLTDRVRVSPTEVRVVLCCYYLAPDDLLKRCKAALRLEEGARFDVYSTNADHRELAFPEAVFHRAENQFNDFSAYIAACRDIVEAGEHRGSKKVYLFLNDTLFTRHPGTVLVRLLSRLLATVKQSDAPILCGKADPYRALLQTSPLAPGLDQYVSTFLFATNGPGVELLHRLFTSQATAEMIRDAVHLRSDVLPKKFLNFLRHHLGSEDPRFAWQGIQAGRGVDRKAACVLLEHLISARFFEEGFIFPLNYSPLQEWVLWGAYRLRRLGFGR